MSQRKFASVLLAVCAMLLPGLSRADSEVRIVRLSYVDGDVQIDRRDGRGFERAILNMPVVSGARFKTGNDARAEIEFEEGSTIRLSPHTSIEFTELSRRESGKPATSVRLQEGTAYFNVREKDGEEFSIEVGRREIRLAKSGRFRLQLQDVVATLAVYKGEVKVAEGNADNWIKVGKNKTLTLDLDGASRPVLAKEITSNPYDQWNKERDQYRDRYGSSSDLGYYGSSSDLNYYGRFIYVPQYGNLWRPSFVSAAWNPFADGAWVSYPGFGYTWVSGYPWGWTPYHYGSWLFIPSYGWCWNPRGGWSALNNIPTVVNPPAGFTPPQPPSPGGAGVVAVGRGPNPGSHVGGRRLILDTGVDGTPAGSRGGGTGSLNAPGFDDRSRANSGRSAADPGDRPVRGPSSPSHVAPIPAAPSASHGSTGGVASSRPSTPSPGGSHGGFGGPQSSGSHGSHSGSPRSSNPR